MDQHPPPYDSRIHPPLQPPLNGRTMAYRDERRRNLQRSQTPTLTRNSNVGERWRTTANERRSGFPSRGSRVQIPSPAPPILRSIKAIRASLRLANHPKVARPPLLDAGDLPKLCLGNIQWHRRIGHTTRPFWIVLCLSTCPAFPTISACPSRQLRSYLSSGCALCPARRGRVA